MTSPDIQYVNFSLLNDTDKNQHANLTVTRDTPIIDDPSKYYGSITRFTIDANWPLFVPTIPDPNQPLVTNMSITFSYLGVYFRRFVELTADEAKNGVFDFNPFLMRVNAAASLAFTDMKTAYPAAFGVYPPYFALEPKTGLISMYVDEGWLDTNTPPNYIWFNSYLQDVLNLPTNLRLPPPQANGADYQITVKTYCPILPASPNRVGFPYALAGLAGNIIQVSQEYVQLSSFSDIVSILFTTNLIPVVPEITPYSTGFQQNGIVQSNFIPVITDFIVSRSDAKPRDNSFVYLPTAEYRRFCFSGNTPLKQADISAFYTTTDGKLHKLFLPPGGSLTLKLLIENKEISAV